MADFRKNELCVICSHEKQSLMFLFCGHVFCEQCLSAHKSFQERSCCPICGTPRDGRRYTPVKFPSSKVKDMFQTSTAIPSEANIHMMDRFFSISISRIVGSGNELDDIDHSDNNNYDNHYRDCSMERIECTDDDETINSN
uniref:RING-type domain-containing protein n=1 Tax=Glossina palpalis gambiensis TaxID=67801 RepID=A0A1B0BC36_9MUSC